MDIWVMDMKGPAVKKQKHIQNRIENRFLPSFHLDKGYQ